MFCHACGSPNDANARFCARCGQQLQAGLPGFTGQAAAAPRPAPIAPVPAAPMPVAQPAAAPGAAPALASIGDRLIAVILDTVVLVAGYAVIGVLGSRRMGGATSSGFNLEGGAALLVMGGTALAGFLYYWLLEGVAGATLGKGIMGIQVRRVTGAPCGLGASLVRNLLRLIDGFALYLVGLLVALFSKRRQRIGDHAAGTVVVSRPPGGLARTLIILLWLLVVAGGFLGAVLLHKAPPAQPGTVTGITAVWPRAAG